MSISAIGPQPEQPTRGRSAGIVRRIKEQMGAHDLTKQQLAARTGINRVTLFRRLSGALPFTIDELEQIAEALDVDFDWLITGRDLPPSPVPPAGFEPAAFCSEEPVSEQEELAEVFNFPTVARQRKTVKIPETRQTADKRVGRVLRLSR